MPATTQDEPLVKYALYKFKKTYLIVGENATASSFRVLKINPSENETNISIENINGTFDKKGLSEFFRTEEGNGSEGKITFILNAYAILGLTRFTSSYYLYLCIARKTVAVIGGHSIYHVDNTRFIELYPNRRNQSYIERKCLSSIEKVDLARTFYYSYSYDLSQTLQYSFTHPIPKHQVRDMFVWNWSMLQPILDTVGIDSPWCIPLIHGFVDQAKLSVYGKPIIVTLIARRSRHFAGARFLRRGIRDDGYVANEVETEQIVFDGSVSSFPVSSSAPGIPCYTSYVQHRGSIPLRWSQEFSNITPKPPIGITVNDPFYSAAALHFDRLFGHYGAPCIVLNLVKSNEKVKRESLLLNEFEWAINYLNQFLDPSKKIQYIGWDMSAASKRKTPVTKTLETMAYDIINKTGLFCTSSRFFQGAFQQGILRTNCVDCLDRTNAAQFVFGKCALAYQLQYLGVLDTPELVYESDAVRLLAEMYHGHGDTIALQYGGSLLVNTLDTYRKNNQWSSTSRDLIESVKRFYSNSFVDYQRQDAIDLFLGNFTVVDKDVIFGKTRISNFTEKFKNGLLVRRDYRYWWTPLYLNSSLRLKSFYSDNVQRKRPELPAYYFEELYTCNRLSFLSDALLQNMISTLNFAPLSLLPLLRKSLLPVSYSGIGIESPSFNPFIPRTDQKLDFKYEKPSSDSNEDEEGEKFKRVSLYKWLFNSEDKLQEHKTKQQAELPSVHKDSKIMNKDVKQLDFKIPSADVNVYKKHFQFGSIVTQPVEKYQTMNAQDRTAYMNYTNVLENVKEVKEKDFTIYQDFINSAHSEDDENTLSKGDYTEQIAFYSAWIADYKAA
ncbi:inositol polyphosphate phosphatase [Schizosaccharomyces octosporus yFS286]|uniref:Inositol polyphosphate phosphatase n=1 Tax=Schizosaccharomyces octosporus (strain yFS286) TaxID=483514 RepID=S9PYS8_SCHOY|nr:inositol polyphosphate phosphatase [Schizosaccharomyces octosporus yFS286]EPX73122.1 inositol polyphosphate phosphatase [Schizosaccharomyces octosporus yFS286]